MQIFARQVPLRLVAREIACVSIARLTRCLLGADSVADRKLECGNPLTILGIAVALRGHGVMLTADTVKIEKWSGQIRQCLASGKLTAGEASKMAGRLTWASQCTFRRVGRAFLYPIYRQQRSRKSGIGRELELALRWWLEALSLRLCELRPWRPVPSRTRHLLVDARSTPPRVAAVLLFEGKVAYSDMEPPQEVWYCPL